MRRITFVLLGVLLIGGVAAGQIGQAVEGQVTGKDVYVRSGPSQNWYPMLKLSYPARVQVLGREGDWLTIASPPGTYSLISKRYVTADGSTGTVTGNAVQVRAGSDLYPNELSKVQTSLDSGEKVTITGEAGDYYRIVPPAGVLAYISAKYVQTAPKVRSGAATQADSPEAISPEVVSRLTAQEPTAANTTELIKAFQAAETALVAEYKKPLEQRDLVKLMEMYEAIAAPAGGSLATLVDYRIGYLNKAMQTVVDVAEVNEMARRLRQTQQELAAERAQIHLAASRQSQLLTEMTLTGRLGPSMLFPGNGVSPKRWVIRDEATGDILGFLQATGGTVQPQELYDLRGWKVSLSGTSRYDWALRMNIIEVTRIEMLPGGEPIKPAVKGKKDALKGEGEPRAKPGDIKPEAESRPAPTPKLPASTLPAGESPSESSLGVSGLPVVEATAPAELPIDADEYK
ncbi:MAG: hypothetical protein HQ546_09030 [Planctomycetes bacterium]|nr:hypothetical protein [Planctomycetota bacterium]